MSHTDTNSDDAMAVIAAAADALDRGVPPVTVSMYLRTATHGAESVPPITVSMYLRAAAQANKTVIQLDTIAAALRDAPAPPPRITRINPGIQHRHGG